MKKMMRVGLMVAVAVFMVAIISVPHVMAAENGATKAILIDETSVSEGFTPASTYIMLAQQERTTAPVFPELPSPPSRVQG